MYIESLKEIDDRLERCETFLKKINNTTINQYTAKQIYQMQKFGFIVTYRRINESLTECKMRRKYFCNSLGNVYQFNIEGKVP